MNIAHTAPPDLVAAVAGDRVRVRLEASRVALPTVLAADGPPTTGEVLAAAGDPLGTIMAPAASIGATRLHLVAVDPAVIGDQWLPLDALDLVDHPAGVAARLRGGVAEFRGETDRPSRRPDWYRAGWRAEIDAWVDQTLSAAGRSRRGPSVPVAVWSLSCVLRVPTAAADSVFVKAACDWFRAEPAITALLHRVAGDLVPEVLGTNPDRGWLLMAPLPAGGGETPTAAGPPAAAALARIQVLMLDHFEELGAAGVADRRLAETAAGFTAVLADEAVSARLTLDERRTAAAMRPWLVDQLVALAGCGMPYSLGHGDLHLGNVAYADGRAVLYDWTDAALTFPALDVELLAGSAGDAGPATRQAYVEVWREVVGEAAVATALRHAPAANLAYQAISYHGIARAVEPQYTAADGGIAIQVIRRLTRLYAERSG